MKILNAERLKALALGHPDSLSFVIQKDAEQKEEQEIIQVDFCSSRDDAREEDYKCFY